MNAAIQRESNGEPVTDIDAAETSLTIQRVVDAARERVYRTFADPDELEA